MTKEEYLRKVAEMQTDISAIKQEGVDDTKTCKNCIHQAVCYRYSYGLPENYADKYRIWSTLLLKFNPMDASVH